MTDKELLEFCKQHKVKIGVSYDPDGNSYHLRMKRGWLQINYIFSRECVDTAKAWNTLIQSKLNEMEEGLTRMEKIEEEENK